MSSSGIRNFANAVVVESVIASALRSSSGSVILGGCGAAKDFRANVRCTALDANGVSPTLDVKVQDSFDGGAHWTDLSGWAYTQIVSGSTYQSISFTAPHGDNLRVLYTIAGQAKLVDGAGTASLAFTSVATDGTGNVVTVTIVQGAGALSVAVVGNDITITLAAAGSTAAQVKTAYDLVAAATALATVATSGGGGGTVLVAPQASLANGGFTFAMDWVARVS